MGDRYDYYRNRDRGMGGFSSGLLGIILGALGAFLYIFFSKRENREKARSKVNELRDRGMDKLDELRKKTEEEKEQAKERLEKVKEEVENKM